MSESDWADKMASSILHLNINFLDQIDLMAQALREARAEGIRIGMEMAAEIADTLVEPNVAWAIRETAKDCGCKDRITRHKRGWPGCTHAGEGDARE